MTDTKWQGSRGGNGCDGNNCAIRAVTRWEQRLKPEAVGALGVYPLASHCAWRPERLLASDGYLQV